MTNANDRDAIEAVGDSGGITSGVGADVPFAAEFRIESPEQVLAWMARLEWDLSSRPPHGSKSVDRGRSMHRQDTADCDLRDK